MIKITDYAGLGAETEVLSFAAEKLGIDGVEVIVVNNEQTLDKFSDERWFINALLHKLPVPNTYELFIRKKTVDPLRLVLCHEAVHLYQFVSGQLRVDMEKKEFFWKGKKYPNSYEYDLRPWEREAFAKQAGLAAAFRKRGKKCLLGFLKRAKK